MTESLQGNETARRKFTLKKTYAPRAYGGAFSLRIGVPADEALGLSQKVFLDYMIGLLSVDFKKAGLKRSPNFGNTKLVGDENSWSVEAKFPRNRDIPYGYESEHLSQ